MTAPATKRRPHEDCSFYDIMDGTPCADGDPATCPAVAVAEARRRAQGVRWSTLETRDEGSGERHYLDGEPIHCGDAIEMQAFELKADDYGEYEAYLQRGQVVRYELAWPSKPTDLDHRAMLYANVGGHSFTASAVGKRYRWPRSGR